MKGGGIGLVRRTAKGPHLAPRAQRDNGGYANRKKQTRESIESGESEIACIEVMTVVMGKYSEEE